MTCLFRRKSINAPSYPTNPWENPVRGRGSGYPHLFVLDSDGAFLHSQSTGPLEEGRSYDKAKLMGFLKEWGVGR